MPASPKAVGPSSLRRTAAVPPSARNPVVLGAARRPREPAPSRGRRTAFPGGPLDLLHHPLHVRRRVAGGRRGSGGRWSGSRRGRLGSGSRRGRRWSGEDRGRTRRSGWPARPPCAPARKEVEEQRQGDDEQDREGPQHDPGRRRDSAGAGTNPVRAGDPSRDGRRSDGRGERGGAGGDRHSAAQGGRDHPAPPSPRPGRNGTGVGPRPRHTNATPLPTVSKGRGQEVTPMCRSSAQLPFSDLPDGRSS